MIIIEYLRNFDIEEHITNGGILSSDYKPHDFHMIVSLMKIQCRVASTNKSSA